MSFSAAASLAQTTNHTPSELFQQRQSFTREEEVKPQTQEPATVVTRIGPACSETQHPQNHTSRELNQPKEDQTNQNNVQASQSMNTRNTSDRNPDMHRVPIALLLPVIIPQLDKDRAMQLQGHYARLRSNSISKKEFCRQMQAVVGDHMLKKEIYKLQQGKDETMHPGAHVEAFTAAVSRDTDGDNKNTDNANIINSVTEKPPTTTTTVVATTSRGIDSITTTAATGNIYL
ncbi:Histone-fold [Artemisia annua]|uniref:Histone-fold n=1 Tax=Artemisia annua TaxID=35608 RepID=A0A2U1MBZ9_ARTAN|nr:Histone-fold [Artemisia annua]